MKLTRIATLAALALILSAGTGFAQDIDRDQSTTGKMLHKLGRGVTNVFTSWVEIPRNIAIQWEKTDPVTGLFVGGIKGIGWGFARLATGAYETVTFPFPVPPGYEPMMQPEFVIDDIWGDHIPELTELDSNDPNYPSTAPVYPQNFNY